MAGISYAYYRDVTNNKKDKVVKKQFAHHSATALAWLGNLDDLKYLPQVRYHIKEYKSKRDMQRNAGQQWLDTVKSIECVSTLLYYCEYSHSGSRANDDNSFGPVYGLPNDLINAITNSMSLFSGKAFLQLPEEYQSLLCHFLYTPIDFFRRTSSYKPFEY